VAAALRQVLSAHGPQAAAVLASPQMTNEELFRTRLLFKDRLGIQNVESIVRSNAKVFSDDFLVTADKNPNTRGVEIILPPGAGSESLLRQCAEGRIHWLYVFQHDMTRGLDPVLVREALGKVDCVVFDGSWDQPTAALADIQLPAAVYAEKEGTFANVQGRVQRIRAAIPPMGESLPDLEILARLASELDISLPGASEAEVFAEIGQSIPAFAGMTYSTVGNGGQLLRPETGK
jgi:predicted molibdopterin-dependent oxidoreductase YjgC